MRKTCQERNWWACFLFLGKTKRECCKGSYDRPQFLWYKAAFPAAHKCNSSLHSQSENANQLSFLCTWPHGNGIRHFPPPPKQTGSHLLNTCVKIPSAFPHKHRETALWSGKTNKPCCRSLLRFCSHIAGSSSYKNLQYMLELFFVDCICGLLLNNLQTAGNKTLFWFWYFVTHTENHAGLCYDDFLMIFFFFFFFFIWPQSYFWLTLIHWLFVGGF